jgi:DNA invertase Pin-like site-specific DNA recombinase
MIYGYVRVSTLHQNVENGRFEVANFAHRGLLFAILLGTAAG